MGALESLMLDLFRQYLRKEYRGFMFWTGLVRILIGLTVLSMITVVWFIDWWWKLGVSTIVLLVGIDYLNRKIGEGIFEEWLKSKK